MIAWRALPDHLTWGRVPSGPCEAAAPRFVDEVASATTSASACRSGLLPVGAARSYGAAAQNPGGRLLDMTGLDRFIAFDAETGVLRAESGLTLDRLLRLVAPHGWFVRTSPGTRFVTLGGAVANDVHGKNHHRAGAFGLGVRRVCLLRSDADGPIELSPTDHPDLFAATLGGLGLTGTMLWVELQLERAPSSFMVQETVPFGSVAEFEAIAAESAEAFEWTAAWVDCTAGRADLGRGFFFRANWSAEDPCQMRPPGPRFPALPTPPFGCVTPLTVAAFNRLYAGLQRMKPRTAKAHYEQVLHPLDTIGGWNRIYGPAGFRQYQFVAPKEAAESAVGEALEAIRRSGEGSFLAVLKTFGPLKSQGLLSFPMEGTTLAVDFRNRGEDTLLLFSRLDAIVQSARGRLYPAKDARMPSEMFRSGYPDWEAWAAMRDPVIQSDFTRRMLS